MKHPYFIARTVLVLENNIDEANRVLNSILNREGLIKAARRLQFYEKPWQTRRRVAFERCKAIYNEEMTRKVQFLSRKNRVDPYPGC